QPLARELAQESGGEWARELVQASRAWSEPWRGRARDLAARLEESGSRVWPLVLVAETAMGMAPELATQALDEAQRRLESEPAGESRDQDLARLVLALATWDAARARDLAERVGDPLRRAWVWRGLVRAGLSEATAKAAAAAREAPAGPAKALALAHCGQVVLGSDPALAMELFGQAWDLALGLDPAEVSRQVRGQVAAAAGEAAPLLGLELARRLEPGPERLAALRRAGLSLLGQDLAAGRALLAEAADQLPLVAGQPERALAAARLAQDLAGLDPELALDLMNQLPPGMVFLRGRVADALLPALASRSLDQARAMAEAIVDPGWRALALARLAGIHLERRETGPGLALAGAALELAKTHDSPKAMEYLAKIWAAPDPRKGVDIALGIGENVARVRALLGVARVAERQQQAAAAAWALYLAEEALSHFSAQQAIDKIGLLGDMGQEWAARDEKQARRFFQQGAATALTVAPGS
ncbi:MAG: hypothetical protein LDL11_02660, partial [Desulfarculus sp.]|nr:hypothetical protein [Desulfarculus sp.]